MLVQGYFTLRIFTALKKNLYTVFDVVTLCFVWLLEIRRWEVYVWRALFSYYINLCQHNWSFGCSFLSPPMISWVQEYHILYCSLWIKNVMSRYISSVLALVLFPSFLVPKLIFEIAWSLKMFALFHCTNERCQDMCNNSISSIYKTFTRSHERFHSKEKTHKQYRCE